MSKTRKDKLRRPMEVQYTDGAVRKGPLKVITSGGLSYPKTKNKYSNQDLSELLSSELYK